MGKQTKIGTVPSGWIMKKLKDVFYINEFSLPSNTPADYQFKYITIEQVSTNHIDYGNCETFRFSDAPGRARRIVRDNDILISGVRPNLKSFAIFNNPDAGSWICSTGFFVLTAKNEDDNLISYYELLSEIGERQFYSYVAGSNYPAIGDSDIRNIRLVLPSSVKEKTAIANILLKVDEAIAAVQGSIAAAERLKKCLMQNLLTGRMKPDGTLRKEDEFYMDEKFGKVPKGWSVKKVKDLFYMNQDTLSNKTDSNYKFRYITIEAVSTESIDYKSCPEYSFKDSPGRARRIIKDNDILISGVRPNLKAFAIYTKPDNNEWICSTGFHVLTAKDEVCPQFFFYQILSHIGASQFHSWVAGSNYPAIGDSDMRKMQLYAPPYDEQVIINQRIECISRIQQDKQTKIAILERLKKSLMQNLLTGRVRVNNKNKDI